MVEPDASELDQPDHGLILMSCCAPFDGLTWGTLRRFVALAGKWDVSDDAAVELDFVPEVDDFEPIGLKFTASDRGSK